MASQILLVVILLIVGTPRAIPVGSCSCTTPPQGDAGDTYGTLGAYNDYQRDGAAATLRRARERFIINATEQLHTNGLAKKDYDRLLADAKRLASDDRAFIAVSDVIVNAASERKILCQVTFCTIRPGAVIYYQTVGERVRGDDAHSLSATTNCVTQLPIGVYFIWATRDGRATSDTEREIAIINATECVQLAERS